MEMQQVRYFVSLADHLNFTKASEHCDVSQPSLTRAIQALEAELGGPLFRRERANTHLTELGHLIRPFLTAVVENASAARAEAQAYAQYGRVTLKIGVVRSVLPSTLTRFLTQFHSAHKDVKFVVKVFDAEALLEALKAGKIDLAVLGAPYKRHAKFHVMPLYVERYAIMVSGRHPLAGCSAVTRDDLLKHPFVSREHCHFSQLFEAEMFSAIGSTQSVLRTDRDDWALEAISAGLGYGVMAQTLGRHHDLVSLSLEDPRFESSVDAITVRGRQHSPAFGALVRDVRRFDWSQGAFDQ